MDDIPGRYLKDIDASEKDEISKYPHIEDLGSLKLHWKELHEGAFRFYVLEWVSNDGEDRFDIAIHGVAYFDGLRHLYFGEEGYFYYPNLPEILEVLTRLREIEKQICWHVT